MTTTLNYNTVDGVGFDSSTRYANVDKPFDAAEYAEAHGLDINDIDQDSIKAIQNAASQEGPGSWLVVSHAAA